VRQSLHVAGNFETCSVAFPIASPADDEDEAMNDLQPKSTRYRATIALFIALVGLVVGVIGLFRLEMRPQQSSGAGSTNYNFFTS